MKYLTPFAGIVIALVGLASLSAQHSLAKSAKARGLRPPMRPSASFDLPKLSTKERLDVNASVVHATCRESRVGRGPGGNIFTYVKFDILSQLKGASRKSLTLRYLGGTLDGNTIQGGMETPFQAGTEYVLMLGAENRDGYPTLDPGGVYLVQVDPSSKRPVVVPGLDGIPAFEATTGKRYPASPEWMFLDDFLFSLRKAL